MWMQSLGCTFSAPLPRTKCMLVLAPSWPGLTCSEAEVRGRGGHGAYPHQVLDPVWLSAQVINAVHWYRLSAHGSRLGTGLISICTINAGTAMNILPESVRVSGTIRYFTPAVRNPTTQRSRTSICRCLCLGQRGSVGHPTRLFPNRERFKHGGVIRRIAVGLLGQERVEQAPLQIGSEDFSYMAQWAKPTNVSSWEPRRTC